MNTKMVKRTQFNISAQDVKIYYNQIQLSTSFKTLKIICIFRNSVLIIQLDTNTHIKE